ncbi:MAG TPA: metallophosphoesterase, partial [Polyangiales bacterium]|nr:metallophosphoesterase [Polyangiales bacterium]
MKRLVALLLACVGPGCTRATPESAQAPPPRAAQAALSADKRLVAIGDVHGDLAATRRALSLAGALGADDHWAGGTLQVVQTGDTIDRGDQDREVLDLLDRLQGEATRAG